MEVTVRTFQHRPAGKWVGPGFSINCSCGWHYEWLVTCTDAKNRIVDEHYWTASPIITAELHREGSWL